MEKRNVCMAALLLITVYVQAATLLVPSQYPTIQAGIGAAVDGDTVLVAAGTYQEQINYLGKEIVVKSTSGPEVTTIIKTQTGRVVIFGSGEGRGAVLEGFTITNGGQGGMTSGGVACAAGTAPTIRGNIIRDCGHWWCYLGGGISVQGANPLIENNIIEDNEAAYVGAGICLHESNEAIIVNNTIAENYTWSGYGVAKGGGIYGMTSNALIAGNLIRENVCDPPYGAAGGGIALEGTGSYQILNNTFANNESVMPGVNSGGGIYIAGTVAATVYSNIIVNSQGGGIVTSLLGIVPVVLDFNDVWNNTPFNYFGMAPGPYSLSLDPQFLGGIPFAYILTASSPCIDAGSFTSDPDPDGTRADIGCYSFDQVGMHVALVADNFPINILAGGGSFGYTLHLTNHTAMPYTFDFWIDVVLPDGSLFGPIIVRPGNVFTPGEQYQRHIVQNVPGNAPGGDFQYRATVGFLMGGTIYHQAYLPFFKEGGSAEDGTWRMDPTLMDLRSISSDQPVEDRKMGLEVSPNPFNPTTVASFELRVASHVSLRVYDTAGRLVGTLLEGWREAGSHSMTFDGSALSSGIYLYQLSAGDFTATGKLMLVK